MQIELVPTLIDMYRETFEGEVRPGWCWIVSGPARDSVLGSLDQLTVQQAYAVAGPERKSIAAHTAHLKYTLELTLKRLQGENPPTDWPGSFHVDEASGANWEKLRMGVKEAYLAVLAYFEQQRQTPIQDWQPIHVAGLTAMIGHNAYHLGAIRQLMLDAQPKTP